MGIDMWEHSYYLEYTYNKKEYVAIEIPQVTNPVVKLTANNNSVTTHCLMRYSDSVYYLIL